MQVANQAEQGDLRALGDTGQWHGANCAFNLAIGDYQKFSYASKAP